MRTWTWKLANQVGHELDRWLRPCISMPNSLRPGSSLQTAVEVNANTIDLNTGQDTFNLSPSQTWQRVQQESRRCKFLDRDAIPDPLECTKCAVIIAVVLDGVYISGNAVNCLHTVIKLAVAHMGVHLSLLSLLLRTSGGKTK